MIPACENQIPPTHILACKQNQQDGNVWAAARSQHAGGVLASRCDASVQFYANTIELSVWQALATMTGGEAIPEASAK